MTQIPGKSFPQWMKVKREKDNNKKTRTKDDNNIATTVRIIIIIINTDGVLLLVGRGRKRRVRAGKTRTGQQTVSAVDGKQQQVRIPNACSKKRRADL